MKTNDQLKRDVETELAWDPEVTDGDIRVDASDGVVTLKGAVPDFTSKYAAQRAVERVFGTKAVANELEVVVPVALHRSDTSIARAIVQAWGRDTRIPAATIRAAVDDGWVTLDGGVEWHFERDAAAKAIRNLGGVRGITNRIKVLPNAVSSYDIGRAIHDALERRANQCADEIDISTAGSVVTLTGKVASLGDRRAAEDAAWSAPGVTEVHNEIVVAL